MDRPSNAAFTFAFVILLLSSVGWATAELDEKASRLADFANDLPANLSVENTSLNTTSVRFSVSGTIENNGDQDWELHLISNHQDGTGWHYERFLGLLQPGTSYELNQYFQATYSGKLQERTQYAVVAKGDAVNHGAYFWINEDWNGYVRNTQGEFTDMAIVFVPVAGAVLLLIIIVLAEWAYTSQAKGEEEGEKEYTMRTFFIPHLQDQPFWVILADLLTHPLVWLLEMGILGVMANSMWLELAARVPSPASQTIWIMAMAAAALMPMIYFTLVWAYNELYERMPLRFMMGMFIWGITAASLALVLNTWQSQALGAMFGLDSVMTAIVVMAVVAPFTEEFLKGLGLMAMRGHHEFDDALHGLHLGFAVGVGFAFVENWFYLASRTDPLSIGTSAWIGLAIYRSIFNALAHGSFSAVLGAGLGWAKSQKWGNFSILAFLPGLVMAVVLHSLFNLTALSDSFQALSSEYWVFGFNPIMTLTLVVILGLLAAGATADYRRKRSEKLAKSMERMRR